MKKVTVIVTTYNQEDTIARAIDSILAQNTCFDYEILIGEDASTDLTRNICEDYAARFPDKVRLMPKAPNKGLVNNYFDCILEAKGEYIADCAGDDYWIDPLKLRQQVEIMDSDPEITLCHTNWVESDGISIKQDSRFPERGKYLKPLIKGESLVIPLLNHEAVPIIHLCTALYRRDTILECYREDPSLFRDSAYTCEDLQIEVALASKGKIAWIPDTTLCYSIGHSSISSPDGFGRRFRYFHGTLLLTRRLQMAFSVPDAHLMDYYTRMITFLLSQAVRSKDPIDMKTARAIAKEIPHRRSLKNTAYILASHFPVNLFRDSDNF